MTTKKTGAASKTAKKSSAKPAKGVKAPAKKPAPPAAKPKAVKPVKAAAPKPPRPPKKKAAPTPSAPAAMNRRRQQRFRPMLLEKHQALLRAYSTSKGGSDVGSDGTEDYIDYAVSSYTREFALSLSEMERKQLRLVEEALRRITRGEYGQCLNCNNPIPEPRLEVEPWASYCIRCQELEELGLLEEREREPTDDDDGAFEDDAEEIKDDGPDLDAGADDDTEDDAPDADAPGGDEDDDL